MMDQTILNPAAGHGKTVSAATRAKPDGKADGENFGDYVSASARQHGRKGETAGKDGVEASAGSNVEAAAEDLLPTEELAASPAESPVAAGGSPRRAPETAPKWPKTGVTSASNDEAAVHDKANIPAKAATRTESAPVDPDAIVTDDQIVPAEEPDVRPTNLGEIIRLLGHRESVTADDAQAEDAADAGEPLPENAGDGEDFGIGPIVSEMVHDHASDAGHSGKGQDGERTFAFSRADGKGGRLEMVTGHDKHFEPENAAASARSEDIIVLDARRYPGLAPESNGLALSRAIHDELGAPASSQTSLLADGLPGNLSTTVHTLKLQMHPGDLGAMTASLRLKGDELSVDVIVETADAYRQLSLDQDQIVKALREQGFSVDQVTIQLAPTDRSADAGGQGSAQGQSFRDGAGQASDGRNGDRPGSEARRQQAMEQNRWQDNETILDGSAVPGNGDRRSGQVYI